MRRTVSWDSFLSRPNYFTLNLEVMEVVFGCESNDNTPVFLFRLIEHSLVEHELTLKYQLSPYIPE